MESKESWPWRTLRRSARPITGVRLTPRPDARQVGRAAGPGDDDANPVFCGEFGGIEWSRVGGRLAERTEISTECQTDPGPRRPPFITARSESLPMIMETLGRRRMVCSSFFSLMRKLGIFARITRHEFREILSYSPLHEHAAPRQRQPPLLLRAGPRRRRSWKSMRPYYAFQSPGV